MRMILGAALLAAIPVAAQVQTPAVYRCGDQYTQQPCADGKIVPPAAPAPTAAESRSAGAAAQRDARMADALEKERLRQEAKPAPLYVPPARIQPATEHKSPERAATRKLDVFTATAPAPKPAKPDEKAKGGSKAKPQQKAAQKNGSPGKPPQAAPAGRLARTTGS